MSNDQLDQKIVDGLVQAARVYFAGEPDKAVHMLSELEREARTAKLAGLSYVLVQKAGWLRELGRRADAHSTLEEAEGLCQAMEAGTSLLVSLRLEQGIVARIEGRLAKAEAFLEQAQTLAAGDAAGIEMMSDILANLSSVYMDQGRLQEAQAVLHKAIDYDAKTGDIRALASNLNMLGLMYNARGDRQTARVYLTRSKDIAAAAGLVKEIADATSNLAALSDDEGFVAEAKMGFEDFLEAATKSGRLPDIASAKSSLGILAAREGDFETARELMAEARRVHSELNLAEDSTKDLLNLAQTELQAERPQAAYDFAIAALANAQKHGLIQLFWGAHYLIAQSQLDLIKQEIVPKADIPAVLQEVLANYTKAADAIDLLRAGIGRPEERERLLVDKEVVFQEAVILAGLLRNGPLAWAFAERARGRAFLDSVGTARLSRQKHPLAARRTQLIEQLLEIKDADGERQALSDELRLLRSCITAEAPAIAAITASELPTIKEITTAMPPDTAIIEFFVGPANRLTIFVLKQTGRTTMNTIDIGTIDLAGKVQKFRDEVQREVVGEPTGEFLFMLLFSPVWDAIASVRRLIIVPHGVLHYIPFAALWFKNIGEGPGHLYLCQRFLMSILPSASFFKYMLNRARPVGYEGHALVLGDPTENLPSSGTEAITVAASLKVSPLLGPQAARDRVLSIDKEYAVIHIASHGTYNENDPLLSGIFLSDGLLTVEDMLEAHIPVGLLTLSGCLTGVSARLPGDELIGLSRAALAAGIPSVITTLWKVWDHSTAIFFERFYIGLRDGKNKDAALTAAQHSMLAEKQYAAPSNWAPYVLLGNGQVDGISHHPSLSGNRPVVPLRKNVARMG